MNCSINEFWQLWSCHKTHNQPQKTNLKYVNDNAMLKKELYVGLSSKKKKHKMKQEFGPLWEDKIRKIKN